MDSAVPTLRNLCKLYRVADGNLPNVIHLGEFTLAAAAVGHPLDFFGRTRQSNRAMRCGWPRLRQVAPR
jgi:hypothetical protein